MSSTLPSAPVSVTDLSGRVLALSGREPRRALSLARRGLRSLGSAGPEERGRLLRAYGHALRAVGNYRLARSAYLRARATFAARRLTSEHALCALGLIDACMYLGKNREALRVATEARRVFLATDDKIRLAKLETNVGNLFHHVEALEPALRHYERASALFAEGGTAVERATVDHNRANILTYLGRRDEAERLYTQAGAAFEEAGEPILAAQVRYGLACLRFLSGEYAAAIAELESVRPEISRFGAAPLLALADIDLSEVLLAMRLYPEALALARSAGRWFRERGVLPERARCELTQGLCLSRLGRHAEARARLEQAERLLRGRQRGAGPATVKLARAQLALHRGSRRLAVRVAMEARAAFARSGFASRALAAGALAAEVMLEEGDPARARRIADSLLRAPRRPGEGYTRARLLRVQASSAARSGSAKKALRLFQRAIEEARNAYASIFVDEWRVGFVDGEPAILDEAVGVLLSQRPQPAPEQVWRWIRTAGRAPTPRPRTGTQAALASPMVARRIDDLRAELETCYARLWRLQQNVTRHAAPIAHHLERRALRLEGQLRRLGRPPGPRPARSPSDEPPDLLAPGEIRIHYIPAGGELAALRHSEAGWKLVPALAPVSEIVRRQRFFHYQMAARSSGLRFLSSYRDILVRRAEEHLRVLSRLILDPVLEAGGPLTVLAISPYGPLHRIPFHALTWRNRLLAEQAEISLPFPAQHAQSMRHRSGACVVAFGEQGNRIEREAASIAAQLAHAGVPVEAKLGGSAKRDAFLSAAGSAALLHLVGHAVYRAEHPEFSAVRVADGWINANDLAELPLEGACVVLSACDTGARGVAAGDEILGLVRGAIRGRARTIVTSLWQVDDRSTARFMMQLYRNWQQLTHLGAAFRAAQEHLARETGDPYLWAGFCLMGDRSFPWPAQIPCERRMV